MKKDKILEVMKQSAISDNKVMVYFNDSDRFPIAGWFINLDDSEYMLGKGIVRFVSISKELHFANSETDFERKSFTRLLSCESIFHVKTLSNGKRTSLNI